MFKVYGKNTNKILSETIFNGPRLLPALHSMNGIIDA